MFSFNEQLQSYLKLFRINIQTVRLENSNFAAWSHEMAYE